MAPEQRELIQKFLCAKTQEHQSAGLKGKSNSRKAYERKTPHPQEGKGERFTAAISCGFFREWGRKKTELKKWENFTVV